MPWFLLLGGAAVIVVIGVVTFFTHDAEPPREQDIAAEVQAEIASCRRYSMESWNAWAQGEMEEEDPGYTEYLSGFTSAEAFADEECRPEYFNELSFPDPRFCLISLYDPDAAYRSGCPDYEHADVYLSETKSITINGKHYRSVRQTVNGLVPWMSTAGIALAAILGASFIGAEYKFGTIETTVLWEPRRIRVLGSKLVAAALSAFVIHVVLLSLLVAVMMPAALWRGSVAGADADFWSGLVGVVARGGVTAAAIAAIALSVSVLTRNTVGGVAALLGYTAISPALSFTLLPSFRPFDLTENTVVFANGGEVGRFVRGESGLFAVYSHGVAGAALRIAVYVSVFVVVALVVFHRRDID